MLTDNDIIDMLAMLMLVVLLFLASGCGGFDSGFQSGVKPSFWTQCIKMDGWGFTMATAYGPFNVGKLTWERNVNCKEDVEQSGPFIPK